MFWLYFYDIYCKSKLSTYQDSTAIKSRPARSALFDCIRALAMVSYIGSQLLVDKGNMVLNGYFMVQKLRSGVLQTEYEFDGTAIQYH